MLEREVNLVSEPNWISSRIVTSLVASSMPRMDWASPSVTLNLPENWAWDFTVRLLAMGFSFDVMTSRMDWPDDWVHNSASVAMARMPDEPPGLPADSAGCAPPDDADTLTISSAFQLLPRSSSLPA